jgi:hypothetical protein
LGWFLTWWIEKFCVHGPGDVQGEPVVLDDEFTEITVDCYALEESGRRLYDSVFVSRAKGRAKSELAGFITLGESFAPVRFAGWARGGERYTFRGETYVYQAGEPIGRPVKYPFIRCLATEETQAGNTYDNVYFNLTDGPLGEGLPRDTAGLTRVLLPTKGEVSRIRWSDGSVETHSWNGGEIVPSTASSASKDGGKETFCTFDESHIYVLPDLKQMYRTVRRNLGKRKIAQPWSLETSTMYAPGEDSVAEESHKLARNIKAGKARRGRLLFDHREAPDGVDLTDEDAVIAALREVYGPFSEVMDLERILTEIYDPRNPVAESRRYFFNQATSPEDSFLSEDEVRGAADVESVVADKDIVVLGFDGSAGRSQRKKDDDGRRSGGRKIEVADSTGLVATRVTDGHQFVVGVWEQPPGVAGIGWEPPRAEVEAALVRAHATWKVVGFYGDPAHWSEEMARWTAKWGASYKAKRTQDQPIRWKTNQHTLWADTVKAYRAALRSGAVTHDGTHEFVQHLLNARNRATRSGLTIAKDTPDSPNKIDLVVAGVYSYAAYLDALAAGVLNVVEESWVPVRVR